MLPKSTTKQTKCSEKFLGGSSVEVPQEMLHQNPYYRQQKPAL